LNRPIVAWLFRWKAVLILGLFVLSAASTGSLAQGFGARGFVQPVYFSHRQHAAKKLKCTFCHSGAERSTQAAIPGVAFCMSCHSMVKPDSPEVIKTKAYLDRKEEIPWVRVYQFTPWARVFFSHRRHAASGTGCPKCHGPVDSADVLKPEVIHTMASCMQCHRENAKKFRNPALAEDCITCHR
jgi:hypothetical protein